MKAAFLLNFAKFAEWPAAAFLDGHSPLEICVLGKDPFGPILDELVQGESVSGRKVIARRITSSPAPQTCQITFIDPVYPDLDKVVRQFPVGVLTVSEGDQFTRDGGMIAFVISNRRVRFDISQTAAENGGIKLSSRLLGVARAVTK